MLTVQVESAKFQAALREWQKQTKKDIVVSLNNRMSFLLMRIFVLLPPRRVQEARDKVGAYMKQELGPVRVVAKTGKPIKQGKRLRRVHLIAQAKNKKAGGKGLYGEEMKAAATKLLKRAVGSVGYLKSALVPVIRAFNGHFTQFGRAAVVRKPRKGQASNSMVPVKRAVSPNGAFVKMMASYGMEGNTGNVAIHKGAKPKYKIATAFQMVARGGVDIGIADNQTARVRMIYDEAIVTAFHDERMEMELLMRSRMEQNAIDIAP